MGINIASMLARYEADILQYTDEAAELSLTMDNQISGSAADEATNEAVAATRIAINKVKAALGFSRTSLSHWKNESNEFKASRRQDNNATKT